MKLSQKYQYTCKEQALLSCSHKHAKLKNSTTLPNQLQSVCFKKSKGLHEHYLLHKAVVTEVRVVLHAKC